MSEADLTFDGVSMAYGGRAVLSDVDLRVDPGERVAILGPSGAGKTTLLRIAAGMIEPVRGRCRVFGAERDGRRADVAFVPQDHALVPNLRVAQNVLLGGLPRRSALAGWWSMLRPSRRLPEVHALLDRLGIGQTMFQRTDRLSGGQQQRVAIARALFQRPRILLLDEPVASVDPVRAASVLELVTELAGERDITLCFSLHDVELARRFCPRLVGLRAGRVHFDGPGSALTADELQSLYASDAA